MRDNLIGAVQERRVLAFLYGGLLRTVEAHAYGASAAGDELLLGYQTAGFSHSREEPGWRLYRVDRISALAVTPYTFHAPRPGFNPEGHTLSAVFAQAFTTTSQEQASQAPP